MKRNWYIGLLAGTALCAAAAVAAFGQSTGQIILTTLTGSELFAVQTSGPQSAAISSTNLQTYMAAGGSAVPGAFTTLSASSTVSGAGFTARFAVPGPIGSTTPSTGAFTTLSASTSATLSPTGAVTINPTTASAIDNSTIGVTTPLAGKFTTLAYTTSGGLTVAVGTDSGQTATSTLCQDTTTHGVYFGSGTAGVCKGTSSMRFKENIGDVAYGLDEVLRLRPVSYTTKAAYGDPNNQLIGFLAEDTANIMPKSVTEYDAAGAPSSVDYTAIIPVLVKAIQQQQAQIDQLKRQLQQ